MWYTYKPETEEEISKDITEALRNLVGGDNFQFVWYENPKMTIPGLFHVQVFWTTI